MTWPEAFTFVAFFIALSFITWVQYRGDRR